MQVVLQKHPSRESGRVKIFAACALPLPTASIVKSPRSKKGYGQRAFKSSAIAVGPGKYGWEQPKQRCMPGQDNVDMVAIADIKRPLQGTRSNDVNLKQKVLPADAEKVEALMESIRDIGLLEPIDILLVEGKYYGFSGCHRFEACQRLGHEKILAKIRKANRSILQMHFR